MNMHGINNLCSCALSKSVKANWFSTIDPLLFPPLLGRWHQGCLDLGGCGEERKHISYQWSNIGLTNGQGSFWTRLKQMNAWWDRMMYDDVHSSQQSPCASPLQPGSPTQRCSKSSWPGRWKIIPRFKAKHKTSALPIPSNEKACLHCKHKRWKLHSRTFLSCQQWDWKHS